MGKTLSPSNPVRLNCLYLSFQDPYFHLGSYLISDNYGHDPKPAIASAIREELKRYSIPEQRTTFIGSSKGAASALMMSNMMHNKQLIMCSLSTDLYYPIRDSNYSHLGTALDFYGVEYPDTLELLIREADRTDVYWFYSRSDHNSNLGNENIELPRLKKFASDVGHSAVLATHFKQIAEIADQIR